MIEMFNTEAEQMILGAVLKNHNLFDHVPQDLSAKDFSQRNARIFSAMGDAVTDGERIDIFMLGERLSSSGSDDIEYLSDLVGVSSGSNVKAYGQLVIAASLNRGIYALGNQMLGMAESNDSVPEKLAQIAGMVNGLERNQKEEALDFNDILKSEIDDLDERFKSDGSFSGFATGFAEIDKMHNGWEAGDYIVMAGRPSMGKTTLAMNVAENCIQEGGNVLVFSLEMTAKMLTRRLISASSTVGMGPIKTGKLQEDDWAKLELGVRKLKDKNLKIIDTPSLDISVMASIARRENRKKKLDLIVIDYLQLITHKSQERSGRFEQVSDISRIIKQIAKNTNTPIIAISQLSRKCEERSDKRPMSSDLRESGQIEQDADFITFVYRDEVYDEKSPSKGVAEFITAKNRNGETGTAYLASRLQYNRFFDLDESYQPPKAEEKPLAYRYGT